MFGICSVIGPIYRHGSERVKTLRAVEPGGGKLPDGLLRGVHAPVGMPLLFDGTGQFLQEVHLFLMETVVRRKGATSSADTLSAYADDLSVWWSFLDANAAETGARWDLIHDGMIHDYVVVLTSAISPITGRPYSASTIERRVSTVLRFYEWAAGEGLAYVHGNVAFRKPSRIVNADSFSLAHVMQGGPKKRPIVDLKRADAADQANILSAEQLRKVLNNLGPDLALCNFKAGTALRNRLFSEWALYTGMRLKEVMGLTKAQVLSLALSCDPSNPAKLVKIRLTVTKGARKRDVLAPAFLLLASCHYIEHERAAALRMARSRYPDFREPANLFINGVDTNLNYVGRKMSGKVASRHFSLAVAAAGYSDEVTTVKGVKYVPRFRYHDLRHTFAVRTYVELERLGKREPWKTIQVLLGHRHLSTTINIYLKHVRIDEAAIGDALGRHLELLANGL